MENVDNRKHQNYELLNMIGYGLAKFDKNFIEQFGFSNKQAFYNYIVEIGIAETNGVIKNRQDMLDPFFDNKRKGWWQRSHQYINRKILIDSLFGNETAVSFSDIVKLYIQRDFKVEFEVGQSFSPILKSKFKQLQETGVEAELYFFNNFQSISLFEKGIISDARTFGDGYDYQIDINSDYFLVEVKGLTSSAGSIRMTTNEYLKAKEYKDNYALVVISNLFESPKISLIFNPTSNLSLTENSITSTQVNYHSENLKWITIFQPQMKL